MAIAAVALGLSVGIGLAEYALQTVDFGAVSRIPRPNTVDPEMVFHKHHADSDVAWTLRPGAEGVFQGSQVRVNSFGCRGAEPEPREAVALRVLTVGDSITFGAGVEEHETFSARLAPLVDRPDRRADVVGCGVSGFNLVQSLRRYETDLASLRPDVVVVSLFVDDLMAPYRMHDHSIGTRLRGVSAAYRALELGTAYVFDRGLRDLPPWAEDDAAYEAVSVRRFTAWAAARRAEGIEVIVLIHPLLMDLSRAPGLKAHPELEGAAAAAGVRFQSMEPIYRELVGTDLQSLSIRPETEDPHPAARGHQLIAEALASML